MRPVSGQYGQRVPQQKAPTCSVHVYEHMLQLPYRWATAPKPGSRNYPVPLMHDREASSIFQWCQSRDLMRVKIWTRPSSYLLEECEILHWWGWPSRGIPHIERPVLLSLPSHLFYTPSVSGVWVLAPWHILQSFTFSWRVYNDMGTLVMKSNGRKDENLQRYFFFPHPIKKWPHHSTYFYHNTDECILRHISLSNKAFVYNCILN